MSKDTFEILCNYIKNVPELAVEGSGGKEPISVEKQLLLTLWYLGSLDSIERIADRFGISASSVIRCRSKVLTAIINLKGRFITWPDNGEMQDVINKFSERNGFPGIVGALDGTHIRIRKPNNHSASYINRKGFPSLQLQAVCKPDLTFSHVFTGYPGSCHDSRVLKNSDLWQNGLQLCNIQNHIIADAAYPLRRWLLTPFRDNGHLTAEQRRYNHYHSSNRVVIERAFALLKGRFRRLNQLDTNTIETAVDIIMACCVLHNICIKNHDEVNDFLEEDNQVNNPVQALPINDHEAEGVLKRNIICRNLL